MNNLMYSYLYVCVYSSRRRKEEENGTITDDDTIFSNFIFLFYRSFLSQCIQTKIIPYIGLLFARMNHKVGNHTSMHLSCLMFRLRTTIIIRHQEWGVILTYTEAFTYLNR
jgi:hypothetical protein